MNTNFRRFVGQNVCGVQRPIVSACLCCPFSASRCARLERNCDFHLMRNNLPGFANVMRQSGGSCGSRHWVTQRVGFGFGFGGCAGLYDYFD